MFVGHLAVALATKSAAPRAPLGALVGASFGVDLLWPALLLLGVERVRIDPGNTAFTPLASIPGTLIFEGALLAVAVALYVRATDPTRRTGTWALVGLTSAIWISQPLSPPPPSATAVAVVGLLMWLFPFWGAWIERHRVAVRGATGAG